MTTENDILGREPKRKAWTPPAYDDDTPIAELCKPISAKVTPIRVQASIHNYIVDGKLEAGARG